MVKNPNWWEANHLAILQEWPRIWTRDCREQIQLAVRVGLKLGAYELQVQRSHNLDTLPPLFYFIFLFFFFQPWKKRSNNKKKNKNDKRDVLVNEVRVHIEAFVWTDVVPLAMLLRFSKTREVLSSKANWRLSYSLCSQSSQRIS